MGKIILFYGFLAGVMVAATAPAPVTATATPSALTFNWQSGATTLPKSQKVAVKASAGKPAFTTSTPALDYWLAVNLNGGTLPISLVVSVNPTGMPVGVYTSAVTVNITGVTSPVITVTLNVTAPPSTLSVNPGTLAFTGPQGPLTPQTITLSTDIAPISFTATSGAPWLTVAPATGYVLPGGQVTLTVTADATTLSPAVAPYTAKITVVASGPPVTTKSQSITVTATVQSSAPTITSIWPPSLPLNGPAQMITIRGTNFYSASLAAVQPGSVATALTTTLISDSALLAVIPAALLTTVGNLNILVENPAPGGNSATTVEPVVSAPAIFGLYNSASYANTTFSPGELVTIFGSNIGPTTPAPMSITAGYVDTSLSSVTVTIGGLSCPILYVSNSQVTVQVPYEVTVAPAQPVVLTNGVLPPANAAVDIATSVPGIFTSGGSGTGQAAAINTSATTLAVTLNSSKDPARIGDTISFYLTGEGGYDVSALLTPGSSPTGFLIPSAPGTLPQIAAPTIQIGGVDASPGISYSGVVPGSITGVLQINVAIPTGSSTGPAVPVAISIGGNSTQSNVIINVHP